MMYVKFNDPDRQDFESQIVLDEESFLERAMRVLSRYVGYTALVMCFLATLLILGALS